MKLRISTKIFVVLIITSLVPFSVVGFVGYSSSRLIIRSAADANREIATLATANSTAALAQEKRNDLQSRTEGVATQIDEILRRVEGDTAELADFATYLYNHPQTVGRYAYPSVYARGTNDVFGSVEPNQNSWLMVSELGLEEDGRVSPELMEEIYLTEFLDIKFKSIAQNNPYAVQLYINTASQFTRGMPFIGGEYVWIDATAQFPPDMDLPAFDFYYLADESHDPQRVPVWTELYWDPAGLGWMVSNVAPVYQADVLKGVVGIDITLEKMVHEIIDIQVEETGFAFLMSGRGQAIAFPERAAGFLGFEGSLVGDFGNDEEFSFFLTEANDKAFQMIVEEMRGGGHGLTTYTEPSTGKAYYVAYHPVSLTHWSVGIAVPVEEVIAPALRTNTQITEHMELTSRRIDQRSRAQMTAFVLVIAAIAAGLLPVSMVFSRTISNPVRRLKEGSRRVGAGDLAHRISVNSGDEIEELAETFNQMAADLQHKVAEIEAANEELKKLDKLKSQFISMASHELRTPLIAIQGFVDLIREGEAGEITEDQRQMLNTVSRNTARLARIITELLDLARIEENKLVLRREPLSLAEVIRDVVEEQRPTVDMRRHTLSVDVQPGLPPVFGDRDRIVQVIVNLLGNAIKYTPDGGHIQIKATAEGESAHLYLIDTGIGIKAEHYDRIFSRFYEVGDVTKHRTGEGEFMAGGSGLGLPIVKGIVEAHGGRVWVESEYGHGSTFHVTLPLAEDGAVVATSETAQPPESPAPAGSGQTAPPAELAAGADGRPKVLVIDREDGTVEATAEILAGRYEVIGANTVATGLKQAISQRPDLVLLNARLPGVSGFHVCRTLKRNVNTRLTPVVIFTDSAQEEEEARAQTSGADGYVSTPFERDKLLRLIESLRGQEL